MRTLLLIFFTVLLALNLKATEQVRDRLIIENDTSYIETFPLISYLELNNLNPDSIFECVNTGCYRGVICDWKIENDSLFLIGMRECCIWKDTLESISINTVFNENYFKNGKVHADWFTGEIYFDYGKLLVETYVYLRYLSIQEFCKLCKIENGVIIETEKFDNRISRETTSYSNIVELKEIIYANLDWNKLSEIEADIFMFFKTDGKGNVSIEFSEIETKISDVDNLKEEIEKAINTVSDWDILYKNGKYYSNSFPIGIKINKETKKKYAL